MKSPGFLSAEAAGQWSGATAPARRVPAWLARAGRSAAPLAATNTLGAAADAQAVCLLLPVGFQFVCGGCATQVL